MWLINRKDRSPIMKRFSIKYAKTRDRETDHVVIRFLLFFLLFSSRCSVRSRSLGNRCGSNGECFRIREIFFDLERSFKAIGRRPKRNNYLLCALERVVGHECNCQRVLVRIHERVRNRRDRRIVESQ